MRHGNVWRLVSSERRPAPGGQQRCGVEPHLCRRRDRGSSRSGIHPRPAARSRSESRDHRAAFGSPPMPCSPRSVRRTPGDTGGEAARGGSGVCGRWGWPSNTVRAECGVSDSSLQEGLHIRCRRRDATGADCVPRVDTHRARLGAGRGGIRECLVHSFRRRPAAERRGLDDLQGAGIPRVVGSRPTPYASGHGLRGSTRGDFPHEGREVSGARERDQRARLLVAVAGASHAIGAAVHRHRSGLLVPSPNFSGQRILLQRLTQRRRAVAKSKATKKEKLGVKIVVELTGHMPRTEVDQFMAALTSVVNNHLENGGNGGM